MTSDENLFLERIDCNFPYQDRMESEKLIEKAATLSINALFSVIEELCRIPLSEKEKISTSALHDLLALAASKVKHPLKEVIIDAADKMIDGKELTIEEVISKMQLVKKYPRNFAALNILYFSCDDTEEALESVYDNIIREWEKEY